ncbi:MAG: DUF5107 domain-containing protein [Muribaculaceae bacterium]|nr:DUF5107 domain-containing protein [Muribaculaceae bacterium]
MVKAWKEKVVIPTYEVGQPEKNPIFLENRVYQGSSGSVYPYPVIESISSVRTDHEWNAVFIENEYIKVMVLPELGGRIQMAYDKIRKRHFVYYNHVIKPALVGLAGPWISGGIEFNWPQHHRPSTYMPVDCRIEEKSDGSVTVWVGETERMTHQKGMAGFTLRPGCARLEIEGVLYNPTDIPQTFLWWANPAVAVNDHYRSVFPPDINAVFDHGKRAVSSFPIATGTYYKMDYSAGVDIANYKNIFVPTSYMGVNSRYDFEGGYEFDTEAGMLHVASHHVSPGKKQWTWGNGDFGRAWDRNLTDEDGPYIELMAGVYTENQPDFSWLMPFEEKEFTQYFLPYRELGMIKSACKDLLLNLEMNSSGKSAGLKLFATRKDTFRIKVKDNKGTVLLEETKVISPEEIYYVDIPLHGQSLDEIMVTVTWGRCGRLEWQAEPDEIRPVPDAAEAALRPVEIKTNEQLFLTGLHLEQYRHATFSPVDYYEEALRRDPDDYRCNNALGLWYLRKGRFGLAEKHLEKAVRVLMRRNPNPYDGEPIYNLGVALKFRQRFDEAYSRFYKSTWNGAWQDAGYLACARISAMQGRDDDALYETERCLCRNYHNHRARTLRAYLLLKASRKEEAIALCDESLAIDVFNFGCLYIKWKATGEDSLRSELIALMRDDSRNYEELAIEFLDFGEYEAALDILSLADLRGAFELTGQYLRALCYLRKNDLEKALDTLKDASKIDPSRCFPNSLYIIVALKEAISVYPSDANAHYLLGNIYYDKRQYDPAIENWEKALELNPGFPTVWRNLALAYFNKRNDGDKAVKYMERAFELDRGDSRILMELDQLYKRLHYPHEMRLGLLEQYADLTEKRDDLVLEHITLLNQLHRYEEAKELLDSHTFHPWEGGEGKVPAQYQTARVELAKKAMLEGRYDDAVVLLEECLEYPHHLGEGKLYGAQENDFYYLLGICYKTLKDEEKASACFHKATEGPTEPAAAMYYNDAKPDKIFYAGMAYRALGLEDKARAYFNRLVNYGRQHYHDDVKMDYFAVSLPDLLIWDGNLNEDNLRHCLYMLALGEYGLGNYSHSEKYLRQLRELDINHQGAMALESFKSLSELPAICGFLRG